jgi:hypothetical protein
LLVEPASLVTSTGRVDLAIIREVGIHALRVHLHSIAEVVLVGGRLQPWELKPVGSVALGRSWSSKTGPRPLSCSDDFGEFGERDRDAPVGAGFDAKFVMASPQVLHERVAAHDHAGSVVAFESAHRS